jgi:Protein of unknown function (DUF551)
MTATMTSDNLDKDHCPRCGMHLANGPWRPIKSAPLDKTILIYSPDRCNNCPTGSSGVATVIWKGGRWVSGRLQNGEYIGIKHDPTHWMPLANPPA